MREEGGRWEQKRQKYVPILGIEPRIFSFSRVFLNNFPTSETQYHYAKRASWIEGITI